MTSGPVVFPRFIEAIKANKTALICITIIIIEPDSVLNVTMIPKYKFVGFIQKEQHIKQETVACLYSENRILLTRVCAFFEKNDPSFFKIYRDITIPTISAVLCSYTSKDKEQRSKISF